jgi:hypothetical protein
MPQRNRLRGMPQHHGRTPPSPAHKHPSNITASAQVLQQRSRCSGSRTGVAGDWTTPVVPPWQRRLAPSLSSDAHPQLRAAAQTPRGGEAPNGARAGGWGQTMPWLVYVVRLLLVRTGLYSTLAHAPKSRLKTESQRLGLAADQENSYPLWPSRCVPVVHSYYLEVGLVGLRSRRSSS